MNTKKITIISLGVIHSHLTKGTYTGTDCYLSFIIRVMIIIARMNKDFSWNSKSYCEI
jgi:ABC-type glucose/galactose transport system permease subunit